MKPIYFPETSYKGLLLVWLRRNRPDIFAKTMGMSLAEVRKVLNQETGLNILSTDTVQDGCRRYLEVFTHPLPPAPPDLEEQHPQSD